MVIYSYRCVHLSTCFISQEGPSLYLPKQSLSLSLCLCSPSHFHRSPPTNTALMAAASAASTLSVAAQADGLLQSNSFQRDGTPQGAVVGKQVGDCIDIASPCRAP